MRSKSSAGFSLLEVMAALVITMLLMVSFTPLVTQMLATWARGTEIAGTVELWSRGLRQLRSDLRHAIVWTGYGRVDDLLTFRGTETSMSFPVAAEVYGKTYGLEMLSITVASNKNRWSLIRRRAPIVGSTYTAFGDPIVLLSGPYKYFLRYYDRDGKEALTWGNRADFPTRIAVNIDDGKGSIGKLSVEIPVFASMSAACFAAGNLQGCPAMPPSTQDNDILKQLGVLNPGGP
ncbi:MAG: prepilin-type N-terminal cleavage/methylation domain-containing protein [Rhodomicrobium sp.]